MKVKNIAFSGFAAAILAGAGAAQAAQQLVTPTYVNAAIDGQVNGVKHRVDALEGQMGKEALSTQVKTVTGAINELNGAVAKVGVIEDGKTVAQLLGEKQDALANADVLEEITAEKVAAIGVNTTNITNLTQTVNNLSSTKADSEDVADALALKADKSTTYTKTEVDNELALKANQSIIGNLGTSATVTAYVDAKTQNVVSNETLGQVQNAIDTLEGLVGETAVATQIADAVRTETDARVAADNAIDGRLDTLETAGYQNGTQVSTAISAALEGYTTTTDMNAALNLKANSADVYTKEQADAAIKAYADANDADTVYNDSEVRGLISTNTTNIAANAEDIADNAGAISALQSNTMVAGPATDGLWLAEKKGDKVSWTQVEILDTYSTGDENE